MTDIMKLPNRLLLAISVSFPRRVFDIGSVFLLGRGVELLRIDGYFGEFPESTLV